jgi:hypothetical protein
MSANTMKINELRQRMNVAVSTFYRLFGYMPSVEELKDELGSEFAPVLATYSGVQCRADLRL